ncbi:MAG: sodium-dependent transporter [Chlamydiae bacterium]|nr:sodium-dependent transporter [Chlamydiota bacterium]
MAQHAREHWTGKVGFILATAGSAIGLGSLWRFPYMAGENGGGAFVLLYLLFTVFIGVPVFIGELILGRKAQKSAVLAYSTLSDQSPNWKILGWLNVITSFIILSFYCVVSGWVLSYTLMSLNQFSLGKSAEEIRAIFTTLFASPGINVFWLLLFLLINIGIIHSGVRKGIEYWSKILMPALFLMLIALFCYSATLPGFSEAMSFVFKPDFHKLTPSAVLNALGMALFTLSVGLGILITYGSYMQPKENIPYNAILIAVMSAFVSIMSALMIYPIVFSFGFSPEGGPGLVFQTLPVLFAKLPASILISTVFFVLLLFAALTSTISLLEVLVANLMETTTFSRKQSTWIASLGTFILGVPSALAGSKQLFPNWETIYGKNFFDTMNYITASWMMPIAALLSTLFIGWVMKKEVVKEEFSMGCEANSFIVNAWLFMVRWICPLVIILIILQETGMINIEILYQ